MATQKAQVIEAIRNLDINKLEEILTPDRTYMNVSKELFLRTLAERFESIAKEGCSKFDDVFPGVCQGCCKGCDTTTFISDTGIYFDLLIQGEEVTDIFVCNHLTNFIELDKKKDLDLFFFPEDKVDFAPSEDFQRIQKLYQEYLADLRALGPIIKLEEIYDLIKSKGDTLWYLTDEKFNSYETEKMYNKIYWLNQELFYLQKLKKYSNRAEEQMILYYQAKSEYEKLTWYFENEDLFDYYRIFFKVPYSGEIPSVINYGVQHFLKIDISGYEFVLDYFVTITELRSYYMTKYEPLEEQIHHLPETFVINHLTDLLELHDVFPDLVQKYRNPDSFIQKEFNPFKYLNNDDL